MLEVKPYHSSLKADWDQFIKNSKNGTFLFYRDFMEYHSDRFEDFSLMVYEKQKLLAVLPANRVEDEIFSHQGLTYGGIIFKSFERVKRIQDIFQTLIDYLKQQNLKQFTLKLLPTKYNDYQSDALDYFLFQYQAKLVRRDMNFFIPLQENLKLHKSKKKVYNKSSIQELVIKRTSDFTEFWETILSPILNEKHGVNPVHTLEEIHLLARRFPDNIQQYNVYKDKTILAGMTLFIEEEQKVVKSQYGTANGLGRRLKALDYLYLELFEKFRELGYQYFDLGTTNEADGYSYNKSLTNYKEELGGIPINLDRYQLTL